MNSGPLGEGGAFWFVFKDFPAKMETLYFHFNLCLKFILVHEVGLLLHHVTVDCM